MTEPLHRLAQHRLERAREALRDGALLLGAGSLVSAINRLYYAAFYAARACLALEQLDSARHSGVITLFQRHFIKPGLIDADIGRALSRAFEKRQKSDYGDFAVLTVAEVQAIHQQTAKFVDVCAAWVGRLATSPPAGE